MAWIVTAYHGLYSYGHGMLPPPLLHIGACSIRDHTCDGHGPAGGCLEGLRPSWRKLPLQEVDPHWPNSILLFRVSIYGLYINYECIYGHSWAIWRKFGCQCCNNHHGNNHHKAHTSGRLARYFYICVLCSGMKEWCLLKQCFISKDIFHKSGNKPHTNNAVSRMLHNSNGYSRKLYDDDALVLCVTTLGLQYANYLENGLVKISRKLPADLQFASNGMHLFFN